MHRQCFYIRKESPCDSWYVSESAFREQFRREVVYELSVDDRAELVVQCYISAGREIQMTLIRMKRQPEFV